jgi:uncharacterized protein YfaP (DUF2135 family)
MKKQATSPFETIIPNTNKVFLKLDTSKASNDRIYYFTNGINHLSVNMTYLQSVQQVKFLESIGMIVEDRSH